MEPPAKRGNRPTNTIHYEHFANLTIHGLGMDSNVEIRCCDARKADYHDGDFFYMYWPCDGKAMEDILGRLWSVAQEKSITVCINSHHTPEVEKQFDQKPWLESIDDEFFPPGSDRPFRMYRASPKTIGEHVQDERPAT